MFVTFPEALIRSFSEWAVIKYFLLFIFQLGHIEGEPMRRGAFPITFVHFMADWQSKSSEADPEVDLLIP